MLARKERCGWLELVGLITLTAMAGCASSKETRSDESDDPITRILGGSRPASEQQASEQQAFDRMIGDAAPGVAYAYGRNSGAGSTTGVLLPPVAETSVKSWPWGGPASLTSSSPVRLTTQNGGGGSFFAYVTLVNGGQTFTVRRVEPGGETQIAGAGSRWWGVSPACRTSRVRAAATSSVHSEFTVVAAAGEAQVDVISSRNGAVIVQPLSARSGAPVTVPPGQYVTVAGPEESPVISAPAANPKQAGAVVVNGVDLFKVIRQLRLESGGP